MQKHKQLQKHRKIFDEATFEIFGNNAYHSLCEFVFHNILIFIQIWKNGFSKLNLQYNWEQSSFLKKTKNPLSYNKFFLYSEIFSKIYINKKNENTVMEYKKILD